MTNKEILKKAVTKARYNGYSPDDDIELQVADLIADSAMCFGTIFNHDFAKAFWGEKSRLSPCCNKKLKVDKYGDRLCSKCNSGSWMILSKKPMWKIHLQQMVLESEPLKYLEKFL